MINLMQGDYVFLEDSLSRKRWPLYFKVNNIDEDNLNITYVTNEE